MIFIIRKYTKMKNKGLNYTYMIPGLYNLGQGKYLLSLVKILLFIFSVIFAYQYWNLNIAVIVTVFLICSSFYNDLYFSYKDQKIHNLETSTKKRDQIIIAKALVKKPVWRVPVLNFPYIFLIPSLFFVILLMKETEVSYSGIVDGLPVAKELFGDLLNPNWKLLPEAITLYAKQTVEIALLGTIIAFFISLPVSLFCSWNLMNKNIFTKSIYYPARAIVVTIRAVPTFLLGLIFVALVGLGPFPGVLAIIVFSCGIMIKLFSEAIENLDSGLMESVYASGGTGLHNIKFVVLPQSITAIIAQTLYCTEINVHSATVLGLIGAEGIGLPIHEYLTALSYNNASTFIIVTIAMTIIIDYSSAFIRNKVLYSK